MFLYGRAKDDGQKHGNNGKIIFFHKISEDTKEHHYPCVKKGISQGIGACNTEKCNDREEDVPRHF